MAADEWKLTTLGEVACCRNGAGIKQEFFASVGVPLARVSDFTTDSIDLSNCNYVEPEHAKNWTDHVLASGDLVVATVGSWPPNWSSVVGKAVRVPPSAAGALQNQNTACVLANPRVANQRFLYFLLKSKEFVYYAANAANGSASQARLSIANLEQFPFYLPPLSEQKAIAHILGTLDDKIELNQQMNRTLEAIAQAIFKSWFVGFDPVRAKMDGRQPVGMDAATADLFPDSFEDSPLGKIPKGWSQCRLGDFLTLKRGYDLPTPSREIGTVPIISSSGFSGWHSTAKVKEPGVVTGRYGTIGKVFFVNEGFWPLNTTLYVEDFKGNEPRVAYYLLKSIDFNVYVDKAAVPGVNRNHVHQESIVAPPLTVQRCFSKTLEPLWQKQSANAQEVKTLTAIRDTLLPKLMSGEIRMKEVETLVKAA